jgi:geranylgeranyl diphosphate synthase, type II
MMMQSFHPRLYDSCVYSLQAGGKRIRPLLLLLASGGETEDALFLGSAVECIHTYSLIHDDLPSMDNDDFRRGILTNHRQYSESTAILAGDALNSFSFYLMGKVSLRRKDSSLHGDLLEILHNGGGGPGMVSGQIMDISFEKEKDPSPENLKQIHSLKTGALIVASLLLGNRLREDFQLHEVVIRKYAEGLGILFQLTDDILDEESSLSELGKTPGKDSAKGKLTYPSFYGMEESKKIRKDLVDSLSDLAKTLPSNNPIFQLLPTYIAERKN